MSQCCRRQGFGPESRMQNTPGRSRVQPEPMAPLLNPAVALLLPALIPLLVFDLLMRVNPPK